MKVKALWGFVGKSGAVRSGEEIEVDAEYAHALIGKGLAEEVGAKKPAAPPKNATVAAPAETK